MQYSNILSLLGLDGDAIIVDEFIENDENVIIISATVKTPEKRRCIHCGSNNVIIKDNETVKINFSACANPLNKKVIINLKKKKFKCKECKKFFPNHLKFLRKAKTFLF